MADHFLRLSFSIAVTLIMTGCVPPEVRKGADMIAVFTHQVSEEGAEFVKSRTDLAQARMANIAMLEDNASTLETSVSRDVEIWNLSGPQGQHRAQLLNGLRQFASNAATRQAGLDDLRKQHAAAIAAAKSAANFRQTDLAKVEKLLGSLAQTPDLQSELTFLTSYFKEVKADIDDAKKTAVERAKSAISTAKHALPSEQTNTIPKGIPDPNR